MAFSKKKKVGIAAGALAGVMCAGGILAYFTTGDIAVNEFTVGDISLDLIEPNWPGNQKNIQANEETAKDPLILNDGNNSEYVFMTVTFPVETVETQNITTGEKIAATATQMFSVATNSVTGVNENWRLITSGKIGTKDIVEITNISGATGTYGVYDSAAGTITYLYAYTGGSTKTTMKELKTGAKTESLFDSVKFANVLNKHNKTYHNDDSTYEHEIEIQAFGIQTGSLGDTTNDATNESITTDTAVWTILNNTYINSEGSLNTPDDGVVQSTSSTKEGYTPSDAKNQTNYETVGGTGEAEIQPTSN